MEIATQKPESQDTAANAANSAAHLFQEQAWTKLSTSDLVKPTPEAKPDDNEPSVGDYARMLAKNASLFMPGRYGVALSAATYSVCEIKPGDSALELAQDMAVGAVKGAASKLAFNKLGSMNLNPAFMGVGLALSSRVIDSGLTPGNYMDKSGQFNLAQGLNHVYDSTVDGLSPACGLAGFCSRRIGSRTNGFGAVAEASPLARSIFTGATFGVTSGASTEILKEQNAGETLNFGRIAKHALIDGLITGIAAAPGGYMVARMNAKETAENGNENTRHQSSKRGDVTEAGNLEKIASEKTPELRSNSGDMAATAGGVDKLSLPLQDETIAGTMYRLSAPSEVTLQLPKFTGTPGEAIPAVFGHFQDKMLTLAPRDAMAYKIDGLDTTVIVPKEFDQKLKTDPLTARNSLGPADLPQVLAELPDPDLVTEVRIFNERNPEDYWHEQHTGINSGATSTPEGVVSFFYSLKGAEARMEMKHEWSHIRYDNMSPTEKATVDAASNVERDGLHLRPQSETGAHENFAVTLGEGIMNGNAASFEKVVKDAPVRSLVAADVLEQSLANASTPSAYEDVWKNRINYIRENAAEPARTKLLEIAKSSTDSTQINDAARLLALYGKSNDLAGINHPLDFQLADDPAVNNSLLARIAGAPRVDALNLNGAKGIAPETLGLFADSGMRALSVEGSTMKDDAMNSIAKISTLTRLNATGLGITDQSIPELAKLQSLTDLFLARTRLSSAGRERLQALLPETKIRFK